MKIGFLIQNYFKISQKFLLDILFPIQCLECSRYDSFLCEDCQLKYKSEVFFYEINNLKVFSFFHYDKYPVLQQLLHILKYNYNLEVLDIFENLIKEDLLSLNNFFNKKIYFLPVPLHKIRYKERLFNQSEEIAKILQKDLQGQIISNLFIRNKNTVKQALLTEDERQKNVQNIFGVNKKSSDILNIHSEDFLILVDDVLTTSATMMSFYKKVREVFPNNPIFVITLFKA